LSATAAQTDFVLPIFDLIFFIQLELCTTTLSEWIAERDKLLENPNHELYFKGDHVCRALHRWVKSENTPVHSISKLDIRAPTGEKQWELISAEPTNSCLEGIVLGLNHLHSKQLTHQDLHPENILLLATEDGKVIPKLSDFGGGKTLSRISESVRKLKLPDGTKIILNQQTEEEFPTDPHSYYETSKEDMKDLAEIIFNLYHPPASQTLKVALKEISNWESFKKCFEYQARWIEQLASDDYNKRPTSVDILRQGKNTVFKSDIVDKDILKAENRLLRRQIEELQAQLAESHKASTRP
jgi:serine/threonine protein kinase